MPIRDRHRRRLTIITQSLNDIVTLITSVIPGSGAALALYSLLLHHRYVQGFRGVAAGNMLSAEEECSASGCRIIFLSGPAGIVTGKLAIASDGLEQYNEFLQHIVLTLSQAIQKIEVIETKLQRYSDPEFFLREIRHRHRNLLQLICGSLSTLIAPLPELNFQVREQMEQWFDELLFLYDMLENSPDEKNVGIFAYFTSFFNQIRLSILARFGTLSVVYKLEETLEIPRARATLLALLFLELILNTIKHREMDFVSIRIRIYQEKDTFVFHYTDCNAAQDGKGAVEKPAAPKGMGLEILKQLTSRAGGRRLDDASSVHIFKACFSLYTP
jgi:two-component sensor histidine kinase